MSAVWVLVHLPQQGLPSARAPEPLQHPESLVALAATTAALFEQHPDTALEHDAAFTSVEGHTCASE